MQIHRVFVFFFTIAKAISVQNRLDLTAMATAKDTTFRDLGI